MANKIMKTLTLGGNTYDVYDETARTKTTELEASISELSEQIDS